MKIFNRITLLASLTVAMAFTGCKKDDDDSPQPVTIVQEERAELEVLVNYNGQPITNGQVTLYESESDLNNGIFILANSYTNDKGKAWFRNLDTDTVFVNIRIGSGTTAYNQMQRIVLNPGKRTSSTIVLTQATRQIMLTSKLWKGFKTYTDGFEDTDASFSNYTLKFEMNSSVIINDPFAGQYNSVWELLFDESRLKYDGYWYNIISLTDTDLILEINSGGQVYRWHFKN